MEFNRNGLPACHNRIQSNRSLLRVIWLGKNCKYMVWAKSWKNMSGQKLKVQAETTYWQAASSRPSPHGDSICSLRLYFQLLPSHVLSAFCPHYVFSAFDQPVVSNQSAAGTFFADKETPLDCWLCQFWKFVWIFIILVYMDFVTCRKGRVSENHEFWRY